MKTKSDKEADEATALATKLVKFLAGKVKGPVSLMNALHVTYCFYVRANPVLLDAGIRQTEAQLQALKLMASQQAQKPTTH